MQRIAIDTYVGMAFSNLIAYFIILTVAVTLSARPREERYRQRRNRNVSYFGEITIFLLPCRTTSNLKSQSTSGS